MDYIQSETMFKKVVGKYFQNQPSLTKVVFKEASKEAKKKETPAQKSQTTFNSLDEAINHARNIKNLSETYNPLEVEKYWYQYWEREKFFHADAAKAEKLSLDDKYIIVIPPPNVTGYLHIGHALTGSVEDTLIRYNRMKGKVTCYLPGVDHAGIATQTVVEKQLAKENLYRKNMTRDEFLKKVWEWKNHSGKIIEGQLRRLGSSLDWDRFVFTMDEKRTIAVTEAFIRLFEKGLIYRSTRLVNWSCKLQTAISDIEVDNLEITEPTKVSVPDHPQQYEVGVIQKFAYKIKDSNEEIVVATTRLETMLGDVAVAVNSQDPRYKHLIGKHLVHPFHSERHMTVIADDILVDPKFGTGAVKVTPAHDPADFETGHRHNLEQINIFNDDGRLNENGGPYKGMLRYECRVKIQEDLNKLGLMRGKEPNPMVLKLCSRSKDIIEPMLKPQWYVKTEEVSKKMIEIVENGELTIIPENPHKKIWNHFLSNSQDWCISRQLWWGHRCPAYLVSIKGGKKGDPNTTTDWVVGRTYEEALENAVKKFNTPASELELFHDEDVLDTWFSSALFPFASFDWPNTDSVDFKAFYPNSILETGYDILFFWVAKMVMFGLFLTDKIPFTKVFLHSIVRDEEGKKMSKSLGNVIDPLELIEGCTIDKIINKVKESALPEAEKQRSINLKLKNYPNGYPECGTDALRFGLLSYLTQSSDILLDVKKIIALRQFCNKIWNSYKYVVQKFDASFKYEEELIEKEYSSLLQIHKWILSQLNQAIKDFEEAILKYRFGDATSAYQQFWLYDFCDIYLEATKPIYQGNDEKMKLISTQILFHILERGLRLISPIMPFITEDLYQKLPDWPTKAKSICIAEFPKANLNYINQKLSDDMTLVMDLVKEARSQIATIQLPNNIKPSAYVTLANENQDKSKLSSINEYSSTIQTLAKLSTISSLDSAKDVPSGCLSGPVGPHLVLHIALKDHIKSLEPLIQKFEKKYLELKKRKDDLDQKMNLPGYDKTPEDVKAQNTEKLSNLAIEIKKTQETVENVKKILK